MERFGARISIMRLLYRHFAKRAIDILLSLLGIVFFAPVIIIICCLLWFYMNGSPFFLQRRPGKNQQAFSIIKFKTMLPPVDRNGRHLSSKERITPFGMRLRKLRTEESRVGKECVSTGK